MIQAKELRIGNWVAFTGGKITRNCKVIQVTKKAVLLEDIGHHLQLLFDSKDAPPQPIPLTPEILKKAGLKRYTDTTGIELNKTWRKRKFGLEYREKPDAFTLIWYDADDDYGNATTIWVHYVHQLQNLYFALTGEELNIEL